jgi:MFS family permease
MGQDSPHPASALAQFLAINRTVAIVLIAVLCFGLGEELWSSFLPVYLKDLLKPLDKSAIPAVAATTLWAVGVYACLRNLFEGFCYVGGGHLTARLGDRGSLLFFGLMTLAGYVLFLTVEAPAAVIAAALLILGWEPLSVPVTFTTVGATVSAESRGMAFAVQSIQKRLPKILGPLIAGFVLGWTARTMGSPEAGRILGMHLLVGTSLALGVASIAIQLRWMPHRPPPPNGTPLREVWRQFPPVLRRLLVAEMFTRYCDWITRELVVLYLVLERDVSVVAAGSLFALQNTVALLTYLPIGRMTRTTGVSLFIGWTFIFFAVFPLALLWVPTAWLAVAFVIQGLREIGEPGRKALITSHLPEEVRARGVGLYWGLRSFAFCTAPLTGVVLWLTIGSQGMLYASFGLGCVGAAVFYLFCRPSAKVAVQT